MAKLVVDYDVLEDIAGYAKKVAKKADDYADALTKKVINKFDDVDGGSSSHLSNAKYYVKAKISALRDKHDTYTSLATKIADYSEKAKRIDKEVEQTIARDQERFLDKHDHLRIEGWKSAILNWLVDLKNSCPLFELVGNALRDLGTAVSDMLSEIRHWYECGGGKEILGLVLAIGGLILAVVIFVASFPVSGFIAVCGIIGAAIGIINAINNVITSCFALHSKLNGDPAWAKIYSNRDKLSDTLRQVNFKNATVNKVLNGVATFLDVTELFCDVVSIVDGVSKIYKNAKTSGFLDYFKEAKYQQVDDYDIYGKPCGKKWTMKVNEHGIVETRYTPRSIWRGTKSFFMDKPVSDYSTKGLKKIYGYDLDGIKQTLRYKVSQSPFKGLNPKNLNPTVWKNNIKVSAKTVKSVFNGLDKINSGKYGDGAWEFAGAFFNHSEIFGVADDTGDVISFFKKVFSN